MLIEGTGKEDGSRKSLNISEIADIISETDITDVLLIDFLDKINQKKMMKTNKKCATLNKGASKIPIPSPNNSRACSSSLKKNITSRMQHSKNKRSASISQTNLMDSRIPIRIPSPNSTVNQTAGSSKRTDGRAIKF